MRFLGQRRIVFWSNVVDWKKKKDTFKNDLRGMCKWWDLVTICDDNVGSRAQGNTNFTELFGVKCHIGGADMGARLWIKIFISNLRWTLTDTWVEDSYAFREVVDEDNRNEVTQKRVWKVAPEWRSITVYELKGRRAPDENGKIVHKDINKDCQFIEDKLAEFTKGSSHFHQML